MHLENHLHLLLELNSLGNEKESLNYCQEWLCSVYFVIEQNYKFYCFSQDQMLLIVYNLLVLLNFMNK